METSQVHESTMPRAQLPSRRFDSGEMAATVIFAAPCTVYTSTAYRYCRAVRVQYLYLYGVLVREYAVHQYGRLIVQSQIYKIFQYIQ